VRRAVQRAGHAGFTLIEVVAVVALVAIVSATVTLSLRDPAEMQLQREGQRLIALLETARAESRASGLTVRWWPHGREEGEAFRFEGLPRSIQLPNRWLGDPVAVNIDRAPALLLGPEPMIPAQRLTLQLGHQRVLIATDGLAPFDIVESGATP
jgi:general secretion pathway protein H